MKNWYFVWSDTTGHGVCNVVKHVTENGTIALTDNEGIVHIVSLTGLRWCSATPVKDA